MTRGSVGLIGCAAVLAGAAVGVVAVFGAQSFGHVVRSYLLMGYAALAVLLVAIGFGCGIWSWSTRSGKAAAIGGGILGVAFTGFVVMMMIVVVLGGVSRC